MSKFIIVIGLQAQPFNPMVSSQKNASSGCIALPSSGGRGGSDFSNQQGRKRFHIFLVASNLLVVVVVVVVMMMMMMCTLCSHEHWTGVHISCTDLCFIP
jgi:hypothetical protein